MKRSILNVTNNQNLTLLDAFNSMREFIETYDKNHEDDDISMLLSETQFFSDGITADPAAWEDWIDAVNEITK